MRDIFLLSLYSESPFASSLHSGSSSPLPGEPNPSVASLIMSMRSSVACLPSAASSSS